MVSKTKPRRYTLLIDGKNLLDQAKMSNRRGETTCECCGDMVDEDDTYHIADIEETVGECCIGGYSYCDWCENWTDNIVHHTFENENVCTYCAGTEGLVYDEEAMEWVNGE